METAFLSFLFVLGLIIGSFLNSVICRYNAGISRQRRSFCPNCGKKLSWFELFPVLSFVFQKGRCRGCSSNISWQYPAVELVTAFLFLLTGGKLLGSQILGLSDLVYFSYVLLSWCLLVVIAVYDLKHKIIPDGPVYFFIVSSLLWQIFEKFYAGVPVSRSGILDLAIGPALFLFIASLWFVSSGRWMGFGDAKLLLGLGWFLGFTKGLSGVVLGFWLGAIMGVSLVVLSRLGKLFSGSEKFTMKSEIPFGPFLVLGSILSFFLNLDIFGLSAFITGVNY